MRANKQSFKLCIAKTKYYIYNNKPFFENRLFDAWGNLVKLTNGTGIVLSNFFITDRGYTGHEHLLSVGIIHMNGRLYDPLLHRFLSPDNYVQDPSNTQNFNRYGYVMNNPLTRIDPSGEFFWIPLIIGAVLGGISEAVKPGATFGSILGGALIGGAAGLVGAGVGNVIAGGTFFGSSVATTMGFASGFLSGAAGGFAGGFVGAAGNAWMNGASFSGGLSAGFKAGLIGGISGGLINGVVSEVRLENQNALFRKGAAAAGLTEGDAVPATDINLRKAQEAWFPDAPMNKVNKFTVENVSGSTQSAMDARGAFAATKSLSINGILTGESNVYFNKNLAFSSAKTLFTTMGHEFVHVSQYASLAGQSSSLITPNFVNLMEFHAYSYEYSLFGGNHISSFSPSMIRSLATQFPTYFNSLSSSNFSWTLTSSFKPF